MTTEHVQKFTEINRRSPPSPVAKKLSDGPEVRTRPCEELRGRIILTAVQK